MLNIRKKSVLERVNADATYMGDVIPTPMVTSVLPPREYNSSFGADFNLILMVKEEGPKRIEAIDKEMANINRRVADLQKEREQLTALVTALKAN